MHIQKQPEVQEDHVVAIVAELVQKLIDYGCNVSDPDANDRATADSVDRWANLTFDMMQDNSEFEHEDPSFTYSELWAIQAFSNNIADEYNRRQAIRMKINGTMFSIENNIISADGLKAGIITLAHKHDGTPVLHINLKVLNFDIELSEVKKDYAGIFELIKIYAAH